MTRTWILVLAACGGGDPAPAPDASPDAAAPGLVVVYASGSSDQIAWYGTAGGALAKVDSIVAPGNPSFVAVAPNGRFLYAVAESADRVAAYAIDPADGALTFLNDTGVGGSGPAHVAVDRASRFVLVANYGDGTVSVFPIGGDGSLDIARQTVTAGANAHQVVVDPANAFVFVPCLGSDHVAQYAFDADTGTLAPNAVPTLATANNAGPRHLAFAPDGAHAYLINELDSTLTALAYNATLGRLSPINTVSTLETAVANSTAEVAVHPSGQFVYGSNRGDNSIVTMAVGATGAISAVDWTSTGGATPRHFSLSPDGSLLVVGNQSSDTLQLMTIDATGIPQASGAPVAFDSPALALFAALPP